MMGRSSTSPRSPIGGSAVIDSSRWTQRRERSRAPRNPRKRGNFFDYRAAYAESPASGSKLPAVRVTLPTRSVVTSAEEDLGRSLSSALGRDVVVAQAEGDGISSARAEEYWPDMEGLEHTDTVTEWEMPAGTVFDLAVVHLLTTAKIDRLRALYHEGTLRGSAVSTQPRRLHRAGPA